MKLGKLVVIVLACCGVATGQTVTAPELSQPQRFSLGFVMSDQRGTQILSCEVDDQQRITKCTMTSGRTLEELMQSVYDMNQSMSKMWLADVNDTAGRLNKCFDIAERENKALKRCANSLQKIGESLTKIQEGYKP